jgi:hypothetical protein
MPQPFHEDLNNKDQPLCFGSARLICRLNKMKIDRLQPAHI